LTKLVSGEDGLGREGRGRLPEPGRVAAEPVLL